MAMATSYKVTGRFKMCPKIRRVGYPEFRTVEGQDIPEEQIVEKDYVNQRLVCKNKDQTRKPQPPNYWFNAQIKCRDYRIRFFSYENLLSN